MSKLHAKILGALALCAFSGSSSEAKETLQAFVEAARVPLKAAKAERGPASPGCLGSQEVSFNTALLVKDYSRCTMRELDGIKAVLHLVQDKALDFLRTGSGNDSQTTKSTDIAYLAVSRATLALLQVRGL
jgi:hypothetical protein